MINSNKDILNYYKFHSKIYDITRPLFLFGRKELNNLLKDYNDICVAEIGCGTGTILKGIDQLNIKAYDISENMLEKAKAKISSKNVKYINKNLFEIKEKFDLLIFSYSITMMTEDIKNIINASKEILNANGRIIVLDFHNTSNYLYKKYMEAHSIELNGKLLHCLEKNYQKEFLSIKKAYFGIWEYFLFIGKKND